MSAVVKDRLRLLKLYDLKRRVEQEIRDLEREIQRRRPKAKTAKCGTDGGYYRHLRTLKEPACAPCKAAHTEYEKTRARRRAMREAA